MTRYGSYTPAKTKEYEELVISSFKRSGLDKIEGRIPLRVILTAQFEPIKSASNKSKAKMVSGLILPNKKPDADNIAKCILDGLNGVAYEDDSQVCDLRVIKKYGDVAKVIVNIEKI